MLVNTVNCLLGIFLCLVLGKFVNHYLGGLPGSLYGLLFFALLLNSKVLEADRCKDVIAKIIYFMPLVFLPVCIGLMQYFELFAEVGAKVVFIAVSTTLLGIVFVAFFARFVFTQKTEISTDLNGADEHSD